MAKKSFSGGLEELFQGTEVNNPETKGKETLVSDEKKEVRATFIVDVDLLHKVKAIAYWERLQIKDVVDNAFRGIIKFYSDEQIREIERTFQDRTKLSL